MTFANVLDPAPQDRRMIDRAILPWHYDTHRGDATLHSRKIGNTILSRISGGRCSGWRGPDLIQQEHERMVGIVCNLNGRERHYANDTLTESNPGDMIVWRSDIELRFEVLGDLTKFVLLVPETLLAMRFNSAKLPATWHAQARSPMGGVLSSYFSGLATHFDSMSNLQAQYAIETGLDLVARSITLDHFPATHHQPPLFVRMCDFIDHHLEDELSPQAIAAVHNISTRHLHSLFEQNEITVSGYIRERRLLRCHHELLSTSTTITEIAQRWRFSDSAHFSRLFKQRFGMSPSAAREKRLVELGAPAR